MGAPQRIDETVDRDRLVRMQEEDDQEGSFLRPADSNRAALVPHLEWSEDPKLHALDRNRLVTGERHGRRRRLNEKGGTMRVLKLLALFAVWATVSAAVAQADTAGPPWGPATPHFNL